MSETQKKRILTPGKEICAPQCAPLRQTQRKGKRKKMWRKAHTLLGLFVTIPLILYSITGVLLMHAEDFGLTTSKVKSEFIMSQYGLNFDQAPITFQSKQGQWIADWQGSFVSELSQIDTEGQLIGIASLDSSFVIATDLKLTQHNADGSLSQELSDGIGIPEGTIEKIGTLGENLVVSIDGKLYRYLDQDLLEYEEITPSATIFWSTETKLTNEQEETAKSHIIGEGLPADRVILDIHSGNIFGWIGKLLADIFALGIISLTISGLVVYNRKKKRTNEA